jgi:magnesium chelatase subunit I
MANPVTLGELKRSAFSEARLKRRSVRDEIRENLIAKLRAGGPLFPGVLGFEETVVPQVVNALLSKHNFILLGLRGQAKTRLTRMLTALLDDEMPYLAGSEVRDNPYAPISRYARDLVVSAGDDAPIAWLTASERYVEKLATPDVTIADMIGDLDPIKAAKRGHDIADEMVIHYGLLPRANRGIFAVNELPDLAGKIQVGLFNIMQEGDVQIKGFPVRLPLDLLMVFTANPEDYTARGKIITPLKDRIGSEIRTHYPLSVEQGVAITSQEAWVKRTGADVHVPAYIREVVEQVAFSARDDKKVDKRSGVSQRLPITVMENLVSNAERRAVLTADSEAVPRIADLYAALPSITGKLELEYEGELKGGDHVARELIRMAVAKTFNKHFEGVNFGQVIQWFDLGGAIKVDDQASSADLIKELDGIQGLMEKTSKLKPGPTDGMRAAAGEFVLEGLYSLKRISRTVERGFMKESKSASEAPAAEETPRRKRQFN